MSPWVFLVLVTCAFVAFWKRATHVYRRMVEQHNRTQAKVDALSELLASSSAAHQHAIAAMQAEQAQQASNLSMALKAATDGQRLRLEELHGSSEALRGALDALRFGVDEVRQQAVQMLPQLTAMSGAVASLPKDSGTQASLPALSEIETRLAFHSKLFEASLLHGRERVAPVVRRRSVLFLNHCYYHHYYLAAALRRRGWDALIVNIISDTSGPDGRYFHGEDIDLYAAEGVVLHRNVELLLEHARRRFDMMHFAGDGCLGFFPQSFGLDAPPDIVEWRSLGKKVAYTTSGCNSGIAQSSFAAWSAHGAGSLCDRCPWQLAPEVCNDDKNLAWARKVERYCDVIFADTAPALDLTASLKTVRDPISACLDDQFWRPDLPIPQEHVMTREPGEVLIYHSFGNYDVRAVNQRNIKGTPAVVAAVDRLKAEGLPVRLVFVTGVKNTEVRYVQAQCDIVVDQLNAGRYGANAKEGMMLGKPVVCYINPYENDPSLVVPAMRELPLVSASERTVYDVLRELVVDRARRDEIGRRSREFAVKWHGPDGCAERYEQIYDLVMEGRLEVEQAARRIQVLGASVH